MINNCHMLSVSELQGDAWAAWNASYHEPQPDVLRALAEALYRQDVRERIEALFARLDEQNRRVDALLNESPTRYTENKSGDSHGLSATSSPPGTLCRVSR